MKLFLFFIVAAAAAFRFKNQHFQSFLLLQNVFGELDARGCGVLELVCADVRAACVVKTKTSIHRNNVYFT